MTHVFELATSARSKCRGCKQPLQKGELRFGERLPNPFGEGEVTHWFHPVCAAYKIPEAMLEAIAAGAAPQAHRESLEVVAKAMLAEQRLVRIDGAERSASGQAKCRQCQAPIERGAWRIRLVFHEEGTFSPGGFIHLGCRQEYFRTGDILAQLLQFSPALSADDREALRGELPV